MARRLRQLYSYSCAYLLESRCSPRMEHFVARRLQQLYHYSCAYLRESRCRHRMEHFLARRLQPLQVLHDLQRLLHAQLPQAPSSLLENRRSGGVPTHLGLRGGVPVAHLLHAVQWWSYPHLHRCDDNHHRRGGFGSRVWPNFGVLTTQEAVLRLLTCNNEVIPVLPMN